MSLGVLTRAFNFIQMAVATEKETAASAPKKGRGLSFEEKRKRLGEYFLEKVNKAIFNSFKLFLVCRRTFFN